MAAQAAKTLSQEELQKVVVELNLAMQLNCGLAIGQHKGAYQMSPKDGGFVVRSYLYPTTFNLFGVKRHVTKQFYIHVLEGI